MARPSNSNYRGTVPRTLAAGLRTRMKDADGLSRLVDKDDEHAFLENKKLELVARQQRAQGYNATMAQAASLTQQNLSRQQKEREYDRLDSYERKRLGLEERKEKNDFSLERGLLKLERAKLRAGIKSDQADQQLSAREQDITARGQQLNENDSIRRNAFYNRQQDFRETEPIDRSAAELLALGRSMQLNDEGKRAFADLAAQYRGIQSKRSSMRPKQYDEMMGRWLDNFERSRLDQYSLREPSLNELLGSRMKDLGNGMAIFQKPDGSFDVKQIAPKDSGESLPTGIEGISNARLTPPAITLRRLALGDTKADIADREKYQEQAMANLEARHTAKHANSESPPAFVPDPDDITDEVKNIVDTQYRQQQRLLGIPVDPTGQLSQSEILSSQMQGPAELSPEQLAEIRAQREMEPPSPSDMPRSVGSVAPPSPQQPGPNPVLAGAYGNLATKLRALEKPGRANLKNPSNLGKLKAALNESGLKETPIVGMFPEYAILSLHQLGDKDPVETIAGAAADAIRNGTAHFSTLPAMEQSQHQIEGTPIIPMDVLKTIPKQNIPALFFDEKMNLYRRDTTEEDRRDKSKSQAIQDTAFQWGPF